MAPGLTLWLLLDLAFLMKQLRLFGGVSYSIALVTAVQGWYILSSQFNESSILTMMDITTDGMGFMLSFGDLVWVPFLYSTQTRYLSTYPVMLGWWNTVGITCVFAVGLYIFKASNHQKWLFRLEPSHPDVRGLKSLKTKRGTRLLISGWWGKSRHINYLGDWMQAWPFSLPTGVAGYVILPAHSVLSSASLGNDEARYMADGTGRVVVQGEARGWGMILTYFYILYFAILLIHRERRDDAMCEKKYGNDWETYKGVVRWRIIPGVY
ncbi:ergosterol biosynthesis ERG4/ERG24 [Aspergillus oleicola]